jgi:hypothetical protein
LQRSNFQYLCLLDHPVGTGEQRRRDGQTKVSSQFFAVTHDTALNAAM